MTGNLNYLVSLDHCRRLCRVRSNVQCTWHETRSLSRVIRLSVQSACVLTHPRSLTRLGRQETSKHTRVLEYLCDDFSHTEWLVQRFLYNRISMWSFSRDKSCILSFLLFPRYPQNRTPNTSWVISQYNPSSHSVWPTRTSSARSHFNYEIFSKHERKAIKNYSVAL